jgi:3-hydroxybutyryl-CoA dehydratase
VTDTLEVTDQTPPRVVTLADLAVGQSVVQRVRFDAVMLNDFDRVARDRAPVHRDYRFAAEAGFDRPIIQGFAVASRLSRLIGMYLPGERALLERVELAFRRPSFAGEELAYSATVERVKPALKIVRLAVRVAGADGDHVTGFCQCLVL